MKVVSYIPIKLNNQRTPGKNIKEFDDGTPLCKFMFDTVSQVKGIDERYCYCSDEAIIPYLPNEIHFLKRSKDLDQSTTQCHEIIRSFLNDVDTDIIVLTHVTCPFVKKQTIEACINAVKSGEYDSAFSVSRIREFMWRDGKPLNFDASCAVKTQDLEPIYKETIGVYVFTKDMFLKTNRKVGLKPYFCEVGDYEDIDIDYPCDFEIANAIWMNILKKR